MISTPVTSKGRKYDVIWKRGGEGPKITEVYRFETFELIPGWEDRRDEFSDALRKALPNKRLHR